jgi:hypothetical protein
MTGCRSRIPQGGFRRAVAIPDDIEPIPDGGHQIIHD